jgi:hypothetical protein
MSIHLLVIQVQAMDYGVCNVMALPGEIKLKGAPVLSFEHWFGR